MLVNKTEFRLKMLGAYLVVLVSSTFLFGQVREKNSRYDKLNSDEALLGGRLNNGLSYYIRHNSYPSKLVTIDLVVKAGYLQEDADLMGVSHVLEHVLFKGTSRFPDGVHSYIERLGMSRGSQINASTGYTATVYTLTVPSDSVMAVDLGLNIIRDICDSALLRRTDIEVEREAVLAEHLMTSGSDQREVDYVIPRLLRASYYSQRGIGAISDDAIKAVSEDKLKKFYKDWYRPDLMSINVVGDIAPQVVEKKIKQIFGSLKVVNTARKHIDYKTYIRGRGGLIYFLDSSRKDVMVKVYSKFPARPREEIFDLRRSLLATLYNNMVEQRFKDMQGQYFPPFGPLTAHSFRERGLLGFSGMDVLMTILRVDSIGQLANEVKSVQRELYRIECHGFLDSEFIKAKVTLSDFLMNKKQPTSTDFSAIYTDHFLYGHIPTNPDVDRDLMVSMIYSITLAEVNDIAKLWLRGNDVDVVILAPKDIKGALPDKNQWRNYLRSARATIPDVYRLKTHPSYNPVPPIGSAQVNQICRADSIGLTEVRLSNGITIILKPDCDSLKARHSSGRITLHGFREGGASRYYSMIDYFSAISAGDIVGQSGIGSLGHFDFDAYCREKAIEISPYVEDCKVGFKARSDGREVESLFDIICQYFAAPRKDNEYFNHWKKTCIQNYSYRNEKDQFNDSIRVFIRESRGNINPQVIYDLKLDRVFEIFREQFGAGDGFTFILTGCFENEKMLPLVIRYFSSIYSNGDVGGKKNAEQQRGIVSSKAKDCTIYSSSTEGATVALRLVSGIDINVDNVTKLSAFRWILQKKLRDRLREKEKGVYAVGTNISFFKCPEQRFVLSINFKCPTDRVNSLVSATMEEIRKISKNGDLGDISEYIASDEQIRSRSRWDGKFWQDRIFLSYFYGIDLGNFLSSEDLYRTLTPSSIQFFASTYFSSINVAKFVLLPNNYQ